MLVDMQQCLSMWRCPVAYCPVATKAEAFVFIHDVKA